MTMQAADPQGETLAEGVARRVRGLMGELRISGNRLAPMMSMSQTAFARRSNGELAFSLPEIEQLGEILGATPGYLLGFDETRNPRPAEPDRGTVRQVGLEPTTRWLRAVPPLPVASSNPVPSRVTTIPRVVSRGRAPEPISGARPLLTLVWAS